MQSEKHLMNEATLFNQAIQANKLPGTEEHAPCPILIKGAMLDIEPDDVDEITSTHFDCWCDYDQNDEIIPDTEYAWGESGADLLAGQLIEEFCGILNQDLMALSRGLKYGEFEGYQSFFMAVSKVFIDAGYFCYLSDTRFEIYTGDSIRARYSTIELLDMLATE